MSNFLNYVFLENDELGNIVLYQPFEAEQILLPENASCLAVKTFLKVITINQQQNSN